MIAQLESQARKVRVAESEIQFAKGQKSSIKVTGSIAVRLLVNSRITEMAPKEDLNLPEGEQTNETEAEHSVQAVEPVDIIEEDDAVVSADTITVTEKVTPASELPLDGASNMEDSLQSETKNIAAEISALLDAADETEEESAPTTAVTLRTRLSKEKEEGQMRRDSCFLTEIDDNEEVDDEVFNPQEVGSIVDYYLRLKSTTAEPHLETESIDNFKDDTETEDVVQTNLDSVEAIGTIEDIVEEKTFPEGSSACDIEPTNRIAEVEIISTEADEIETNQDVEAEEIEINQDVEAEEIEKNQDIEAEAIEAHGKTAMIGLTDAEEKTEIENEIKADNVSIEGIEESAQTATVEDIEAAIVSTDNIETTQQTAAIEEIEAEDRSSSFETTETSAQIAPIEDIEAVETPSVVDTDEMPKIVANEDTVENPSTIKDTETAEIVTVEDIEPITQTATPECFEVDTAEQMSISQNIEGTEVQSTLEQEQETKLVEDIKKEFNDFFDHSDKMRVAVEDTTILNNSQACDTSSYTTEVIAAKPSSALPIGEIAVATLMIFLALILFYN
eukprot:GFUD01022921.1.p1 GENE.GFUD01022921.1~~GFUD01022921.1.p1  ORF type:complete len:561 (+),score=218.74 GFUD01022921.1:109-1791(+)